MNTRKCKKCGIEKPFLVVDHDHETGKVRGLLCNRCNLATGLFEDSTINLRSAVRYLNFSHADDLKSGNPDGESPSKISFSDVDKESKQ